MEKISNFGDIQNIEISTEMKKSYLDYAMSVIISRAIPNVNDGLKPVHRRIMYSMYENGYFYSHGFVKCARIVGDVMGKYHPHGDTSIYDALVRMAQDFSMSSKLIQGQGNFGSIDNDPAAAMRYTEAKMSKLAEILTDDLDKNTVNFSLNYDGNEKEPDVLPAKFPNLLVNGGSGIAVGMATNIPTHNLGEVINGVIAYIDNPEISFQEMLQIIPGPDFPTGGLVIGKNGYTNIMATGRGSVVMRGEAKIEEMKGGKDQIIISSIPYEVNKAKLVEKIAELVKEKKIEGISDLRDESSTDIRIVVEVGRNGNADIILNQLYSWTELQTNFSANILALVNGKPETLGILDVIKEFVKFRKEVVTRRTEFLLQKARERAHILIGLRVAVNEIDEIIALIKNSKDASEAKQELMKRNWDASVVEPLLKLIQDRGNKIIDGRFYFTEEQAKAILEMKLSKLTGLESEKIDNELKNLSTEMLEYLKILSDQNELIKIIKEELLQVKENFSTPRRTQIIDAENENVDIEDLTPKEDMVVITTMNGYIKRIPLSSYKTQNRGGKGKSAITVYDEDYTTDIFVVNTHTPILFFSNKGKVYKMKTYKLPLGSNQSKGRAVINILPLEKDEIISTIMPLIGEEEEWIKKNIVFATNFGDIRRNSMNDFKNIQSNGKIAMKLEEGQKLVGVAICDDKDDILLASKNGKCIRFPVEKLRVFQSRNSTGVSGMKLDSNNEIISMSILNNSEAESIEDREMFLKIGLEDRKVLNDYFNKQDQNPSLLNDEPLPVKLSEEITNKLSKDKIKMMAKTEQLILTITENGYGKRTSSYEYRVTNRNGSGITNIETSARNGNVVASFPVENDKEIIMITNKGTAIRTKVSDIRISGRNTQGVTLMKAEDEKVVSVAKIELEETD